MTPRDHYAAAALSGILAAPDVVSQHIAVGLAVDIATDVAVEACRRWGHLWSEDYKNVYGGEPARRIGERRECHRCGHAQTRTLTEVMPPAGSTMMPYDEPGEWKDGDGR